MTAFFTHKLAITVGRLLVAPALALGVPVAHADIVIGQVTPLSGPQAVTGKAIRAGVKLYLDAVNASGGLRGQRVKLVVRDDAQNPKETVRIVNALIDEADPVVMIGTVGTTNLEALAADGVLARSHIPLIGAISGAASVAASERMYVVKARYRDEVDRLFTNLQRLSTSRVGVVYQDDGLGRDVLAGSKDAAASHGVSLVGSASYARNTTDTTQAVEQMISARPDAIFLGATTAAAVDFVKRYRQAGGAALIYGMSIIDPDVLLKKLGPRLARGYAFTIVVPIPSDSRLAVVREYNRLRAAAPDPDLSARSVEGFIAAKAAVWALKHAQRTEPDSVVAALTRPGGFDAGDYTLDFSERGLTGSHFVDFAMFGEGGRVVR